MVRVVIESPLGAETREQIEENKVYARRALLDSLMRGEAPYASHLLYDQVGVLDDRLPSHRTMGMTAGFKWGEMAELVAIYADNGISPGMQIGINRYRHLGIPTEIRYINVR